MGVANRPGIIRTEIENAGTPDFKQRKKKWKRFNQESKLAE
jgi:hypothetical protein